MDWQVAETKELTKTPVFTVEEVHLKDRHQQPIDYAYYRIATRDWVNVFALTESQEVILVEQPRIGMMQLTLEVPGGGIDAGEDPALAAARELEEETGYRPGALLAIGDISPNPAIMTNRLHMYLAQDCFLPKERRHFPDASEHIRILRLPLAELDARLKAGQIHNALAALTILMARRFLLKD